MENLQKNVDVKLVMNEKKTVEINIKTNYPKQAGIRGYVWVCEGWDQFMYLTDADIEFFSY